MNALMYMGHFAIARGARRQLQRLPMAYLLAVSTKPDLHDVLGNLVPVLDIGPDTHTAPSVCAAAIVVAAITAPVFRRGSLALGAGVLVLSHLAFD